MNEHVEAPRPVRVMFVDHTPVIGGAELALATHIAALDRARFHPLVACTDAVPELIGRYREAGADVHVVEMPRLRRASPVVLLQLLRAAWRLRRLARRMQVDLVVANTSRAAYTVAVGLLGTGVPLVCWVRDFLYGRGVFRLLRWRANRVIAVSAAIRAYYGGDTDPRFTVVHVASSIDQQLAHVDDDAVRAERGRWGFTDDDVVVGFMGRLVAEKGVEDVVEAVALAHAEDARIKLLIVGSGRGQAGDVEEQLQETVRSRGMDFVVRAGFQGAEALYYRVFDLFVLGTRTADAYATSVVQAMMAGTPVIATTPGGTPELVHDGVTGLLVPPASPRAIATAILRLVRDEPLARRVADAGKAEVLRNNRESVTTPRVERLYLDVLANARY